MKKKIAALAVLLGLALPLGTLGGAPAAQACANTQAQTYVTSGSKLNAMQAQLTMGGVNSPYENYWTTTSHWVGVQDETTQYLVQAGYNITGYYNLTPLYGFFYEFIGPGSTGPVDITSQVSSGWQVGDYMLFHIWHNSSDPTNWNLEIKDERTGVDLFSHNIAPTVTGHAADYEGHTGIVATENLCGEDLFNDGKMWIKVPQYHIGSTWYNFNQGSQGYHDLYVNGHLDEQGSVEDAGNYASHTWKAFS
jgi:hypothetical protein